MIKAVLGTAFAFGLAGTASAQTLNMMNEQVQQKVMAEALWMPVLNINMYEVTNKKLKGMHPHMIYRNTFYKGLDASF